MFFSPTCPTLYLSSIVQKIGSNPHHRLNSVCKLEDEIFLGPFSAQGVVAGRQNGENVWILQISILSSHQLDSMKMEPFSASRFTLVIALRGCS